MLSLAEYMRKRSVSYLGLDPFPWYRQMRLTDPVSVDEQNQVCEVFRYADVQAVLADPVLFSSKRSFAGEKEGATRGSIAVTDPPRHKQLRNLVSQAFTPRAMAQQAEMIRSMVNELLDASAPSDTLEVISELAVPLPLRVIAGMLGVPLDRREDFKRWSDTIAGTEPTKATLAFEAIEDFMHTLVAERRSAPEADLVSALLAAQVDGVPLTEQEVVDFCVTLLGAGHQTTTHLIGNLLLCLDQYPEAREQVWADVSLVPNVVEETARFLSVVQRVTRMVRSDTQIGGKQLKVGYRVFTWIGAANRDEEHFSDPEVFDIRRSPNRHLGFSSGIHFCLGAPLARLEARIVLEQLVERFRDVQRVRDMPLQPIESFFGYGVERLLVRVQNR